MGRLDDASKRKVVELREAGLSFRKIKAVLELENIKVSAQAIYLFLKEFQGRAQKEDGTAGKSSHGAPASMPTREVMISESRQVGWSDQQLRNLLREASRVVGYPSSTNSSPQAGSSSEGRGGLNSGTGSAGRREAQEGEKDEDIRIVSVTSLAQGTQHAGIPLARSGVGTGGMSGAAYVRRRHTPSPANPVLVARRRLLDKALLHRARVRDSGPQSGQQVTSVRRDLSCYAASDGRKVGLPQTASYDLTTPRPLNMRGLHQGVSPHRRWIHQRVGVPVRSPQNTPRVGVRLPDPSAGGSASQNVVPTTRPQNVTSQPSPPPPPPQRSNVDPAALSSLQEQIQALGSEVRNLGLALRMMVEQQGRLEREQAQQTQVQKQILSTLQELAPRLEPCSVMHSSSTPTMSASCSLASSASFSQSAANQGTFAQCSQAQTRYNEIHDSGLESIEPFSLDQLSPPTINGFQQCPTSEGPLFTHTQARTPVFTQAHPQTFSSNTLSYAPSDSFTAIDAKSVDMPINSANGTFQTRTPPSQSSRDPVSPCEPELNIIKVESV